MRSRLIGALAVVVLGVGGALVAAPQASANQVWYQAVGRPSADAPCPATAAAEASAGWSDWTPSWQQWRNDGAGGFVCSRSITWAFESDGGGAQELPSAGCVKATSGLYADFDGGWSLPMGALLWLYSDCTGQIGTSAYGLVYAPGGAGQADELCTLAFGVTAYLAGSTEPAVYLCNTP